MRRAQMIARHDINAIEQYFCPSCTRERKTHLLVWHLAFVTVCPIHNCRLVSRCETCFHRLNLGSVLEGICAGCGKSIHPLAPNSEQSGPIVGRLLSLIGGIDGTTVPQDVPEVLQGIGLSDAVALILCFGRAMEPIRKRGRNTARSEEHTSELQSLMRISYAVFCLKKKKITTRSTPATKQKQKP